LIDYETRVRINDIPLQWIIITSSAIRILPRDELHATTVYAMHAVIPSVRMSVTLRNTSCYFSPPAANPNIWYSGLCLDG